MLEDPLLVMTTASVYLKLFQCLKTSVVTTIAEISPTYIANQETTECSFNSYVYIECYT